MGHGRGFISDEANTKIYDSTLVKRMFRYAKPYTKYMLLALLFVLLSTTLRLIMPYIQKVGIDRYIIFNNRVLSLEKMDDEITSATLAKYEKQLLKIDEKRYIVNPSDIQTEDAIRWEKDSTISQQRLLLVDSTFSRAVADVILNNRSLFNATSDSNRFYISIEGIKELTKEDVQILRNQDLDGITRIGLWYFTLMILSSIVMFVQIYSLAWVGQRIMRDIRMDLFNHMPSLPLILR